MKPTYEELERELRQANSVISQQGAALAEAIAKIAQLEARLNQNSQNSSKPPSSDRKPNRNQKVGKGGGRPGHKGHHRGLLPEEAVTHRVEKTLDQCPKCGGKLRRRRKTRVFQQVEIPKADAEVTQTEVHYYECECCGHQCAAPVIDAETLAFGPRLDAWINWLAGDLRLSNGQIRNLLQGFCPALNIAMGSIHAARKRMKEALEAVYEKTVAHMRSVPKIRHTDATGWRHKATNFHMVVIRSANIVLYAIWDRHGKERYQEAVGAQKKVIVVCDRASVHDYPNAQYCLCHVLRNIAGLAEDKRVGVRDTQLLGELHDLFGQLFHDRHRLDREEIEVSTWATYGHQTFRQVDDVLSELALSEVDKVRRWAERLMQDRQHLDTYLNDPIIPMTNNAAEQALRAVVIARKLSFGSRSDWGLMRRERIHTAVATLKALKRNVLDFLCRTAASFRAASPRPSLLPA